MGLLLSSYSYSSELVEGETYLGPDVISPNPSAWEGCVTQIPRDGFGGYSGGPCPGAAHDYVIQSWGQNTISQTIAISEAINAALDGYGVNVDGYFYHWHIINHDTGLQQNDGPDPLQLQIEIFDNDQNQVYSNVFDYTAEINQWLYITGEENFEESFDMDDLSNLKFSISGRDNGFWAGYYGGEVEHIIVRLKYSVVPEETGPSLEECIQDPSIDPTCPGYGLSLTEDPTLNGTDDTTGLPGIMTEAIDMGVVEDPVSITESIVADTPTTEITTNDPMVEESTGGSDDLVSESSSGSNNQTSSGGGSGLSENQRNALSAAASQAAASEQVAQQSSQSSQQAADQANAEASGMTSDGQMSGNGSGSSALSGSSLDLELPGLPSNDSPVATSVVGAPNSPGSISELTKTELSNVIETALNQIIRNNLESGEVEQPFNDLNQQPSDDPAEDQKLAQMANPDFSKYITPQLPDGVGYDDKEIYQGQRVIDNPAGRFFNGASDQIHRSMVRQQYERR